MKEVVIVAATRTPIGSFGGSLSPLSTTQLGAIVIKSAIEQSGLKPEHIQEVFMGNVLSANVGQAPATQAAIFAGLPYLPATTINKVCASGMKAIMLAAQSIALGQNDIVLAGGMESMSNVPYYLDKARNGYRLGNGQLTDGLIKDGLWDVYNDYHMGSAAELCATECNVSREDQDNFAIESYKRAQKSQSEGKFNNEITSVELKDKKGDITVFANDEEPIAVNFDKSPSINPLSKKNAR